MRRKKRRERDPAVTAFPPAGEQRIILLFFSGQHTLPPVLTPCAVQVDVARLPEITQALYDPNEQVQEEATREFRTLLSIERNPPIQQVINAGVVQVR